MTLGRADAGRLQLGTLRLALIACCLGAAAASATLTPSPALRAPLAGVCLLAALLVVLDGRGGEPRARRRTKRAAEPDQPPIDPDAIGKLFEAQQHLLTAMAESLQQAQEETRRHFARLERQLNQLQARRHAQAAALAHSHEQQHENLDRIGQTLGEHTAAVARLEETLLGPEAAPGGHAASPAAADAR